MLSSTHPSSSSTARQFVSNENTIVPSTKSSSVSTTTPGKSGTGVKRRAFGDISNKKQAPSSTKSSSNSSTIPLKKTTAFTPRSKLQHYQQQSLIPKANSNATRNPSSFAPKSTKNVSQQAIVPRKSSTLTTTQIKETTVAKTVVFETVDDVELPAGRLFSQQLLDEDDLTDISEDEFNRTLWDDWRASVRQQYDEHGLKIDQEIEMQVQERMKSVFQQEDGKLKLYECVIFFCTDDACKLIHILHSILLFIEEANGIDSLLDWVDDLDLDQELATALVDDDVDDGDWSQPASSILGGIDDSFLSEM
jgi:hypothetical protein